MQYASTRGKSPPADFASALFAGPAPDRGLYVPATVPRLETAFLESLPTRSLVDCGTAVLRPYVDMAETALRDLVADALDFPIPLVELDDRTSVLELYHGPTLAFKDVGARCMARLMATKLETDHPITVLVATSGDTGSAVAHAFLGVEGTRVVVLYPQGKVSPLQEKQFTTLEGNVRAIAVQGTFDDCQRMVKDAFADEALRQRVRLTSANSINLGRWLPQAIYYVHAAAQARVDPRDVVFCTPSGNFGNLTAGILARRMGLPCAGFCAATNVNDVVPVYLAGGDYVPRPSIATTSNAMDVGDPSNFSRLLHLFDGDRRRLQQEVWGSAHDDDATGRAVETVYREHRVVLDPHTAVGYLGLQDVFARVPERRHGILLATAHPAKFREHVEPWIGREIPLPPALARAVERPTRALPMEARSADLAEYLVALE